MQLRFVRSESAFTYFEALELYFKNHGAPIAFYSEQANRGIDPPYCLTQECYRRFVS
ncbi:transposase (plasmid) [Sinorhizobium americanum CCGM7]|nr:transposase [Sinorhizobium americanum CCGM7]